MTDKSRRMSRRGSLTRERLLESAESLFVEHGYQQVSIDRIVQLAGVTKGAFYHHFEDKLGAFRAVFERIDQEMSERVIEAANGGNTIMEMLRAGMRRCFELCVQPRYGRLVYCDGPAVLGWAEWYRIDSGIAGSIVSAALYAAAEAGEIRQHDVNALSTLLLGSILQAGISIAESQNPDVTSRELAAEMDRLLLSLRYNSSDENPA